MVSADEVVKILGLVPLPGEGGFYKETYRSKLKADGRNASTAIYYMVTSQTFSKLHRLPQDEIFHFYSGEPVEMFVIRSDGTKELVILGNDLSKGHVPQHIVVGGSWQGTKLVSGFKNYALLGTTVAPGFEFSDMEIASREELSRLYPHYIDLIKRYT